MYLLPIHFRILAIDGEAAIKTVQKKLPDLVDGSDFANYSVLSAVADGAKIYDGDEKLYGYIVTVEFSVFANDVDHANEAADYTAATIFGDTDLSGYEIGDAYSDGMNENELPDAGCMFNHDHAAERGICQFHN